MTPVVLSLDRQATESPTSSVGALTRTWLHRASDTLPVSVAKVSGSPGDRGSEHQHGVVELIVTISGEVAFEVGGEAFIGTASSPLVLPAHLNHRAHVRGEGTWTAISIFCGRIDD